MAILPKQSKQIKINFVQMILLYYILFQLPHIIISYPSSYISKYTLQQKMQQPQKNLNQRSSHFTLGQTSQGGASIYTQDYTPKKAKQDPNYKYTNPFTGNAINPDAKFATSTTNQAMYRNWNSVDKAALNKDKLNDLRTHHFNLGNYNPNQISTTNQFYHNPKQISNQSLINRQQSKNRMRAHYHDFKQQPYTNFKSTYNKQFVPKPSNYQGKIQHQQPKNGIIFGNHHLPMLSTNNIEYIKKQHISNEFKNPLQQSSSLVLGDKSQSMQTMNQIYYNQKPIVKNQLPQSTMKQLRNTHFVLGGMSNNFQTQMSNNYHSPPIESLASKQNAPHYQSGTWIPKNSKFQGKTTNNRQLPMRKVQPYTKATPNVKSDFSLGKHNPNYQTQFSQNFNPKQPTGPYQKHQKPKDNNITLPQQKGTYETQHRANYINRNLNEGRYQIDIAAKSKIDHIEIGSGKEDNITVYQDQYRRDQQNKSKLFHKDNLV